jgi:hypothetical protein
MIGSRSSPIPQGPSISLYQEQNHAVSIQHTSMSKCFFSRMVHLAKNRLAIIAERVKFIFLQCFLEKKNEDLFLPPPAQFNTRVAPPASPPAMLPPEIPETKSKATFLMAVPKNQTKAAPTGLQKKGSARVRSKHSGASPLPAKSVDNPLDKHSAIRRTFSYLKFTGEGVEIPVINPVPRFVRGIPNLGGRTCYMNSTLQVLFNLTSFRVALQHKLDNTFRSWGKNYLNALDIRNSGLPTISNKLGPNNGYILLALANFLLAYDASPVNSLIGPAQILIEAMFYGRLHGGLIPREINEQQDVAAVLDGLMAPEMLDLGFEEHLIFETSTEKRRLPPEKRCLLSIPLEGNRSLIEMAKRSLDKEIVVNGNVLFQNREINIYVDPVKEEMQLVVSGKEVIVDGKVISFAGSQQFDENNGKVFIDHITVNHHTVIVDHRKKTFRVGERECSPNSENDGYVFYQDQHMGLLCFEDGTTIQYDCKESSIRMEGAEIAVGESYLKNIAAGKKYKIAIKRTDNNYCTVHVYAKTKNSGQQLADDEQLLLNDQTVSLLPSSIRFGAETFSLTKQQSCRLVNLPDFLMLHIKRFAYSQKEKKTIKIQDPVFLPQNLPIDLSCFLDDQEAVLTQASAFYEVAGCIVHSGSSANSGHYRAYVKRGDKSYCMNDNAVSECTKQEFLSAIAQAYIVTLAKNTQRHEREEKPGLAKSQEIQAKSAHEDHVDRRIVTPLPEENEPLLDRTVAGKADSHSLTAAEQELASDCRVS